MPALISANTFSSIGKYTALSGCKKNNRSEPGCKQRAPSLSVCVREVASGVPAAAGEGQAANGLANPQACRFVSSGSIFAPPCSAQQILQTAASPGGSAATAAATPLAAAAAAAAAAPAAPTVPLACKRRLGVRAVACIAEGRLSGFVAVSRVLRSRTTKRDRTGTRDKWSTRGCGVAASQHEIPSPIGSKGKRALPSPSQTLLLVISKQDQSTAFTVTGDEQPNWHRCPQAAQSPMVALGGADQCAQIKGVVGRACGATNFPLQTLGSTS